MENELTKNVKRKTLSPKLDVVFQALFGEVGSESITSSFLEAILQKKIDSIDLSKNPILRREFINDKLNVLDIIAKLNNSTICNIEMQVANRDDIIERILYYWSKTYTRQLKAGYDYSSLEKTIIILIADFNVIGLESLQYHSCWKIFEDKYRNIILTESLEIHIIELPKIDKLYNEKDDLLDWLFFLDNPKSERVIEKMKENKELRNANKKLETMSEDELMQRLADWRESAIIDHNSAIGTGYRRGIKEGQKSKATEIAIKLLKNGISIDVIKNATGLSDKEIMSLKENI